MKSQGSLQQSIKQLKRSMRKCLLLLTILIGSNFAGQSQDSKDTLCFPVPVIRKVLIAASQKKVADSLLLIAEAQVSQLQNTIKLLEDKDIELKTMYDGQLDNLHKQIALYKDQIEGYEKLLRKEKRKRRLITGVGILTTGAMAYLYLTK